MLELKKLFIRHFAELSWASLIQVVSLKKRIKKPGNKVARPDISFKCFD